GPTPPLVKRTSCEAESSRTSRAIVSSSSSTMTTRRSWTPSDRSSRARTTRFASAIFPLRSSLPMMSAAAVRTSPSPAHELARDRLALGVDAEQLLDATLGCVEPFLRRPREANALLEQLERSLERQVSAFQRLDDLAETPRRL